MTTRREQAWRLIHLSTEFLWLGGHLYRYTQRKRGRDATQREVRWAASVVSAYVARVAGRKHDSTGTTLSYPPLPQIRKRKCG